MKINQTLRLLFLFAVVFSLSSILASASPSSGLLQFPRLPIVRGCVCTSQPWYPAGPAMDTLIYPIFIDPASEFTALQASPPQIDFTDWPLPPSLVPPLSSNPNYQVTDPISDSGYYELEFHEGNNFWGCQFNFGNAACGTQIRQAFAHGLDKNVFVSTEILGYAMAIDDPVPPTVDLNTPDPCGWDSTHIQTGTGCQVNGVGGTAYHPDLPTGTGSVNCPGSPATPPFAYTPHCGTQDFCAAADHLIVAGLATGKNSTTCVLTGVQPAVGANPIQIFARVDDPPRLHAGQSYGQFICALFTGAFTTSCNNVLTVVPSSVFPPPLPRVLHDYDEYTAELVDLHCRLRKCSQFRQSLLQL